MPETETRWYYVCDRCGSLVTIEAAPIPEGEEWECADCGSGAVWEFTNKANALAHGNHIRRGYKSGLFRSAS
jgi:DNA-directed RNA polymerase subunit RPC12/RpoP